MIITEIEKLVMNLSRMQEFLTITVNLIEGIINDDVTLSAEDKKRLITKIKTAQASVSEWE